MLLAGKAYALLAAMPDFAFLLSKMQGGCEGTPLLHFQTLH